MEREKLLNMILFVHLAFHTEVFFWGGGVSKNNISFMFWFKWNENIPCFMNKHGN